MVNYSNGVRSLAGKTSSSTELLLSIEMGTSLIHKGKWEVSERIGGSNTKEVVLYGWS